MNSQEIRIRTVEKVPFYSAYIMQVKLVRIQQSNVGIDFFSKLQNSGWSIFIFTKLPGK